ncbi:MAG: hypothetical protein GTO29_13355 [Candidatus Latescibacteria bacterium]|nr:hypothetical protein [Candidatus Latescibacterota bacterium]NIO57238.1 hypothetical protein [Candidatus Latescibacterota bacterium]
MRRKNLELAATIAVLACCLAAVPFDAGARPRRGMQGAPEMVTRMMLGVRGGYDFEIDKWSAGGHMIVPLGPRGMLELIPSGDVFFLDDEMDWQVNLDAAFRGGRLGFRGPIYMGGGIAIFRRDLKGSGGEDTETGFNLLAGLRLPMRRWMAKPFLEARWTFVADEQFFRLVFGFNLPLGGGR